MRQLEETSGEDLLYQETRSDQSSDEKTIEDTKTPVGSSESPSTTESGEKKGNSNSANS